MQDSSHHEDYLPLASWVGASKSFLCFLPASGSFLAGTLGRTGSTGWFSHTFGWALGIQVDWQWIKDCWNQPSSCWRLPKKNSHRRIIWAKEFWCFFRFFLRVFRVQSFKIGVFFGRCQTGNCQLLHFSLRAFQDVVLHLLQKVGGFQRIHPILLRLWQPS